MSRDLMFILRESVQGFQRGRDLKFTMDIVGHKRTVINHRRPKNMKPGGRDVVSRSCVDPFRRDLKSSDNLCDL